MLGSAIPRRWFFSLALVGLVTLFAVSYSAVWSDTASADSQGPGGGTGNSIALQDEQILLSAERLPQGLTLVPGQQISLTLRPLDVNGNRTNSLANNPDYSWSIIAGSGVSIVAGGNSPTAIIQANSSGSATVQGEIFQIQEDQDWVVLRDTVITVSNPGPTPTPAPPLTNPGTPPASIPNSQGVVTPEGSSLVSSTGLETGSSPESQAFRDRPTVLVRPQSVSNFYGISVASIDPTTLPALPANFNRGSSAASITFYNASGEAQTNFRLLRSARVCLPTASSDRTNGISNIRILRYSEAVGQWVALTTTYNVITQQACANASNFSNFAIGVQQLPPTPGPGGEGLPATGGWSPTAGMLLLAGVVGMALVGGGAVSMKRARNSSRPE